MRRPSGRGARGLGGAFLFVMVLVGFTSGCDDEYRTVCPPNGGECAYVAVAK